MNFGYLRVSTEKQTTDNQRFEILKFIDEKNWSIDEWVEETVSGNQSVKKRQLGQLLQKMETSDRLLVTELSRLGRSLMEVMSILHDCMERNIKVYTTKEGYELGDNLSSKVLAFAFGLSAEIERNMISQRTKEALAKRKSEGKKLGRPKGSLSKSTKLTGKDDEIKELLKHKVSVSAIARIMKVNRITLSNYIKTRHLRMGIEQ